MKMMYAVAALVVAAVMMETLVDAQRFNTAGAAMPNTMGVSMNAFDVSETSRVLSGSAKADLALMGRRTILEAKGFSESEIQKELAALEQKIGKWRNQRHALPPELMNMMTEEERVQVGEIGDMTYGELQALVTQLSE